MSASLYFLFHCFFIPPGGSPGYIPYIKNYHFCPLFNCCCQLETIKYLLKENTRKEKEKGFHIKKISCTRASHLLLGNRLLAGKAGIYKKAIRLSSKTLTFKSRLHAKPFFFFFLWKWVSISPLGNGLTASTRNPWPHSLVHRAFERLSRISGNRPLSITLYSIKQN